MHRLPTVGTSLCLVEQPELSATWACSLLLGDKDGNVYIYDMPKLVDGDLR